MKKSILLSSVATAVLLFTGCGGGDSGGGGGDTTTGEKPVFASPTAYDVVAGERKSVTLTVGENIINPNTVFEFSFVNASQVLQPTIDEDNGVIKFRAPSGTEDFNITVSAKRLLSDDGTPLANGAVSDPMTIVFTPVDIPALAAAEKPYKARFDENTSNVDRNFTKTDVRDYNVEGKMGLIWADIGDNTSSDAKSYSAAEAYCDDLSVNHNFGITEQWRIPNKDELLNLIDYSEPPYKFNGDTNTLVNPSMIPENISDNGFAVRNLTNVWAAKEFDKYFYVSENSGVFIDTTDANAVPVRCVSGVEKSRKRLMRTDTLGYTYDERTKFEWSPTTPATNTMTTPDAIEYCKNHESPHSDGEHTGFRLPSINELRSIVENGTASDYIVVGNRTLLSSTPVIDENSTIASNTDENTGATNEIYWRIVLRENGTYVMGGTGGDLTHRITCVKDMQ